MDSERQEPKDRKSPLWEELKERAKADPDLARVLEAAARVMEKNREALQRLADF
jgi:hypothetical protein